jgi:hypothetical protein
VGLAGESKWNVRGLEPEYSVRLRRQARLSASGTSAGGHGIDRGRRRGLEPAIGIGTATEGFAARILDLGFIPRHWKLDPDTRSSAANTAAATAIRNQPSRLAVCRLFAAGEQPTGM